MGVVAGLERERLELEEMIRGCQRSITAEKRELSALLSAERASGGGAGGGVDLGAARVQANASLHMIAEAQRGVIRLSGVYKRLEAARLELVRRATRRRAVELLKERRLAEWKAGLARRDAAAIDEIVSGLAARAAASPEDGGEAGVSAGFGRVDR